MAALCVFVLLFVFLFRFGKSHGTRQPCLCVVVLAFDSLFQKMEDCSNEQHIPCVVPPLPLCHALALVRRCRRGPCWFVPHLDGVGLVSIDRQAKCLFQSTTSLPVLDESYECPLFRSFHVSSTKSSSSSRLGGTVVHIFFVYCNLLRKDSPPRPSIHPSIHACMCIVSVLSLSVC